jgi:hypothetical protein
MARPCGGLFPVPESTVHVLEGDFVADGLQSRDRFLQALENFDSGGTDTGNLGGVN